MQVDATMLGDLPTIQDVLAARSGGNNLVAAGTMIRAVPIWGNIHFAECPFSGGDKAHKLLMPDREKSTCSRCGEVRTLR